MGRWKGSWKAGKRSLIDMDLSVISVPMFSAGLVC